MIGKGLTSYRAVSRRKLGLRVTFTVFGLDRRHCYKGTLGLVDVHMYGVTVQPRVIGVSASCTVSFSDSAWERDQGNEYQ